MSQVLEKPILLDETGQAIAGKLDTNSAAIIEALDDIKDAIGTSGEFIPLMIKVTTPPTKTTYMAGETLDITGMVVMLVASNGSMIDITSGCTFVPAIGTPLTKTNTSISVSYYYAENDYTFSTTQAITVRQLSSIAITTPPTKVDYAPSDALDLTGIVVTATYNDEYTRVVTDSCTFNPADGTTLTSSDTSVTVTYTEDGITKTATQNISVRELLLISVTNPPTTTVYTDGDTLDLTGIEVTATYDGGITTIVTNNCVFSPADGDTLTTANTSINISYTKGATTKTTTQAITVNALIYGAEWDGTATTAWTRTDNAANFTDPVPQMSNGSGGWTAGSSPFDTIQPWAGMQIVDDATVGKLVSIPKFYYKLTQNNNALKIQITTSPQEGFHVSPAHMDRGDGEGERDVVYVGRYHCRQSSYKSEAGAKPAFYITMSSARSTIHNLDSDVWQMDFATKFTIWLLYLVEFADWDSQAKIGYGCGDNNNNGNMGYTDSMTYHTGTTRASRTTYGLGTQYRYIEGLWDNVWDYMDGCYYDGSGYLAVILNPSNFADSSGGTRIMEHSFSSYAYEGGYPKDFAVHNVDGMFPIFAPAHAGGTGTTYACDQWNYNTDRILYTGSAQYQGLNYGIGYIGQDTASGTGNGRGCRLMKLPNS